MSAVSLEELARMEIELAREKLVHGANPGNAPLHQFSFLRVSIV